MLGCRSEASPNGIEMDILNHMCEVAFVADVTIPILAVPDGWAGALAGKPVVIPYFAGGEFLPGGYDLGDGPPFIGWRRAWM